MAAATTLDGIRNLLFDLGGVLYEVNYHATIAAFSDLAAAHGASVNFSQATQDPVFDAFEIGQIEAAAFREGVRRLLGAAVTDEAIDTAWNAMLGGVFAGRKALIAHLATHYPLALLSNTNAIHWGHRVGMEVEDLLAPFGHVFLSFELGMRKPNEDIFEHVLGETGWAPEETLFIEDSPQHIATANRLGFRTLHLTEAHRLPALLGT